VYLNFCPPLYKPISYKSAIISRKSGIREASVSGYCRLFPEAIDLNNTLSYSLQFSSLCFFLHEMI
jgi:hypothetical protein